MSDDTYSYYPPNPGPYQKSKMNTYPGPGDRKLFERASDFVIYGGEFNAVGGNVYRHNNDQRYSTNYNGQSTDKHVEIARSGTVNGQGWNFGDKHYNGPTNVYSGPTDYHAGSSHVDQRGASSIRNNELFDTHDTRSLRFEQVEEYSRRPGADFASDQINGNQGRRPSVYEGNWNKRSRSSYSDQDFQEPDYADRNTSFPRRKDFQQPRYPSSPPVPPYTGPNDNIGWNSPSPLSRDNSRQQTPVAMQQQPRSTEDQLMKTLVRCIKSEHHQTSIQEKSKKRLIQEFLYYLETREFDAREELDEAIRKYKDDYKDGKPGKFGRSFGFVRRVGTEWRGGCRQEVTR
ncbi:hypothetical protein GYMLUDRAFT_981115 [Collybiopsis luxurians FD-317 M1]|uniref:Uncharacterized protein n=1 Tax=Collybiopsis luxurians FD-317 M1 TaxID=944289 RepID=A0A0D0AN14_9AGAR|nr:hypothetical protein GYMLUDRAFT_981115 [Collybiopsis luxurians FD-317 M1]